MKGVDFFVPRKSQLIRWRMCCAVLIAVTKRTGRVLHNHTNTHAYIYMYIYIYCIIIIYSTRRDDLGVRDAMEIEVATEMEKEADCMFLDK